MDYTLGISKIILKNLKYSENSKELNEKKNELGGNLTIDVRESKNTDKKLVDTKLELKVYGSDFIISMTLETTVRLSGEVSEIKSEEDFNNEELKVISRPLFAKASEIIAYVTGNSDIFPLIIDMDFDDVVNKNEEDVSDNENR